MELVLCDEEFSRKTYAEIVVDSVLNAGGNDRNERMLFPGRDAGCETDEERAVGSVKIVDGRESDSVRRGAVEVAERTEDERQTPLESRIVRQRQLSRRSEGATHRPLFHLLSS